MKPFVPPDAAGMRDCFAVYLEHEPEVHQRLLEVSRRVKSLANLLSTQSAEHIEAHRRRVLERLRAAALGGEWEPLLAEKREEGSLYASLGVPLDDWYERVGAFQKVMIPHLVAAYGNEPARLTRVLTALGDYIDLATAGIGEEYLKVKQKIITQQAESIRELSTPVLQVREQLLLIPIVGVLDTQRAKALAQSLLAAVRSLRAKVVVIDITGVAAVDSKVANHLFQTLAAAKLMGAHSIVTGLSAEVAQALVVLGIDISQVNTAGDLQCGLEQANQILESRSGDGSTDPRAA